MIQTHDGRFKALRSMAQKVDHVQCRVFYARAVQGLCRDRRNAWIFCAATLVQALAHAVLALCAGLLGQALISKQLASLNALVDPPCSANRPSFLAFLGLAAAAAKTGAAAISSYGQKWAAFQVGNAVRQEVTNAIVRQGQPASDAARTHATLVVQLRDIEKGVDEGVLAEARAWAHLAPLLLGLVFLSSKLALTALGLLLPFGFVLAGVRGRFRAYHTRAARLAERLHAGVDELVRHLDLWRTYGAAAQVQDALGRAGEEAAGASARADAVKSALSGMNELLAAGALVAVVLLVEAGSLALGGGSVVAFAAVFFLMYRPLRDLGDARAAVERAASALCELESLRSRWAGKTATGGEPQAAASTSVPMPPTVSTGRTSWVAGRLDVEGVHVVRNGVEAVGTSFSAEPGEIVVLVGPTGSGKTTLLRALLGLEREVKGSVRYAGQDLSDRSVGPSERPFAWVPQEPAIVTGTLEENVALGIHRDAGQGVAEWGAAARGALEQIGAGGLSERKRGARIQAGGHELSGGERQWVAIARALASGLPVLLLDEPTSGLDEASQQRVLQALTALRGSRTIVLVTHRPEPLSIADRVVAIGTSQPIGAKAAG